VVVVATVVVVVVVLVAPVVPVPLPGPAGGGEAIGDSSTDVGAEAIADPACGFPLSTVAGAVDCDDAADDDDDVRSPPSRTSTGWLGCTTVTVCGAWAPAPIGNLPVGWLPTATAEGNATVRLRPA
jgi:hypothetical protein